MPPLLSLAGWHLRVRVEMMGSGRYELVGKAQPILMVINPMISTRTRTVADTRGGTRVVTMDTMVRRMGRGGGVW
eukprot:COSAG01_NODE_5017_length_4524_cov_3.064836_5_plen_75_part_00